MKWSFESMFVKRQSKNTYKLPPGHCRSATWTYALYRWKLKVGDPSLLLRRESAKMNPLDPFFFYAWKPYQIRRTRRSLLSSFKLTSEITGNKNKSSMAYFHVYTCHVPPVFQRLACGPECENLAASVVYLCLSARVSACCSPAAPCWVCVIIQQGLL